MSSALRRGLRLVLFVVAFICLGIWSVVTVRSRRFNRIESEKLEQITRAERPAEVDSLRRAWEEPGLEGRLDIPKVGISSIIVARDNAASLRLAVGHIDGTAAFGAGGNVGLAGHRDTVFRRLRDLARGDTLRITTPRSSYRYTVSSTEIVPPTAVQVLDATGRSELTLVTCWPFHYVGHAPKRFVVHALEVPAAAATTPADSAVRTTAAQPMDGTNL